MNLYCIECTENWNIKIKREKDGKINMYFRCVACGFKIFETIHQEELNNLLKGLNYIKKGYLIAWKVEKIQKVKTQKLEKNSLKKNAFIMLGCFRR